MLVARSAPSRGSHPLLPPSLQVPPGGNKTQYEEIGIPVALLSYRDMLDIFQVGLPTCPPPSAAGPGPGEMGPQCCEPQERRPQPCPYARDPKCQPPSCPPGLAWPGLTKGLVVFDVGSRVQSR